MAQRVEDEIYSLAGVKERVVKARSVWERLKIILDGNVLKPLFEKFLEDEDNFRDGRMFSLAWRKEKGKTIPIPIKDQRVFIKSFVSEPVFKKLNGRISGEMLDWIKGDGATWKFNHEILTETEIEDMVLEEITVDTENGTEKIDLVLRVGFSGDNRPT